MSSLATAYAIRKSNSMFPIKDFAGSFARVKKLNTKYISVFQFDEERDEEARRNETKCERQVFVLVLGTNQCFHTLLTLVEGNFLCAFEP